MTVVKLLMDHDNVEVNSKDQDGRTPLSCAAEDGNKTVVQTLMNQGKVEVNSKDEDDNTPLAWAAGRGHTAVVKLLVDQDNVEVNSRDKDGRTALSWAAGIGHTTVVKLLVDQDNVEVDSRDKNGRTPLSLAAENGHETVVELLADRDDVEVDCKDEDGVTPLSWAARNGHETVIQALVNHGANINTPSKMGQTPLHEAICSGHLSIIQLLLQLSANPLALDGYGRTCIDWALIYPGTLAVVTPHFGELRPTNAVTATRALSKSITTLSTSLRGSQSGTGFYELGRCLLFIGDVKEAYVAFQQEIHDHPDVKRVGHKAECNFCDRQIWGHRFACFTCVDVDLCSSCMEKYNEGDPLGNCKGHKFLKISGKEWRKSKDQKLNEHDESVDQWLERLERKYDI